MLTFLATFAVFLLVVFGMSLGWIIKRKSIQGSCGGISSIGMEKVCDCPEPCDARKSAWPGISRGSSRKRPLRAAFIIYFAQLLALAGESTRTPSAPSVFAFW